MLGNGERDNTGEPTITSSMPGNHSVIGVDGSEYLTCALLSNGSVSCWGSFNSNGEMGNGTIGGISEPVTEPVLVNSMGPGRHAIEVAVGYSTVCALITE